MCGWKSPRFHWISEILYVRASYVFHLTLSVFKAILIFHSGQTRDSSFIYFLLSFIFTILVSKQNNIYELQFRSRREISFWNITIILINLSLKWVHVMDQIIFSLRNKKREWSRPFWSSRSTVSHVFFSTWS